MTQEEHHQEKLCFMFVRRTRYVALPLGNLG